ncbi:PaaI family thioesterase [Mesobacterium pallidum]|uniref:PaaI family thioesterase n=1 Tax=Mesobacterium pallidum TaxID=2872037 RepID=UPI001EE3941F|nr:PaaI family thioesterase [Mesobacterium pallidum]
MMTDPEATGRRILAAQPFNALLGTELLSMGDGRVEFRLPLTDQLTQHHGFAHGGLLAYLADMALSYAGGQDLGDCVTVEFKINYLRPGKGKALIARGETLSAGRSQSVARAEIFAVSGDVTKLVAAAQGTLARV